MPKPSGSGDDKYTELAAILPRATSVHAKAEWPVAGEMLRDEFTRCMDLATEAKFDGPYSLIFDSAGSEWDSLAEIQEVVTSYIWVDWFSTSFKSIMIVNWALLILWRLKLGVGERWGTSCLHSLVLPNNTLVITATN